MARTQMAHVPRLFQIRSLVHRKNPVSADLGQFRVIFFFYIKNGMFFGAILLRINNVPSCYRNQKDIHIMSSDLAL